MVRWTEKTLCDATDGQFFGPGFHATGAALHTGMVLPGDIFFALKGETTDGHRFIDQAFEKGAVVAVVDHLDEEFNGSEKNFIVVEDTLQALIQAASFNRERLRKAKVIAVTGSVGKTTTRRMLVHSLEQYGSVFTNQKNYNTLEGVSIDLCRCSVDVDYAVFEVGMNAPGQIFPTASLIQPDIALITTIAENHIGFFPSQDVELIAKEKAQIFLGLRKAGIGVLGLETPYIETLKSIFFDSGPTQLKTFSEKNGAATVYKEKRGENAYVVCDGQSYPLKIRELGEHFQINTLSVAAVLNTLDLPLQPGLSALETFKALPGRGETYDISFKDAAGQKQTVTLVDDSYNAGLVSTKASLERVALMACSGRKILVFGDIGELGDDSIMWHLKLLSFIKKAGIDLVFCCGKFSQKLFEKLPERLKGHWSETSQKLFPFIQKSIKEGDLILVKGSNATNMGYIVTQLKNTELS